MARGGEPLRRGRRVGSGRGGCGVSYARVAVEANEVARASLVANGQDHFSDLTEDRVFSDILSLDYGELLTAARLEPGEADLLHGAVLHSVLEVGVLACVQARGGGPKASLLDNYIEALRAVRPKAFLMEDVFGLAYKNHNRPTLERFAKGVREAGYSLDRKVLLAADHGVPQPRQRLICGGLRADLLDVPPQLWRFEWPAETHAGPHERRVDWDQDLLPHVTVREPLSGLTRAQSPAEPEEDVSGTYAEALRTVPPGENYLHLTN